MLRTGKDWWLTLFVLCLLSDHTAWANISGMVADSTQKFSDQKRGFHVVQKGDTYYSLARQYQIPIDSLKKWNGPNLLLGSTIRVNNLTVPETPLVTSSKVAVTVPNQTTDSVVAHINKADKSRNQEKYIPGNKTMPRILVVPFNAGLYFSDADDDIALRSEIPRQDVRYIFRARLNALLNSPGFEKVIYTGSTPQNNTNGINNIYQSLSYSYQDAAFSRHNPTPAAEKPVKSTATWLQKQKAKIFTSPVPEATGNNNKNAAYDESKYFGAKAKSRDLFANLNSSYAPDYYVFINQFEIHTDYTNCLDRTKNDFVRTFVAHYNIYDATGELVAGNKVKQTYVSHENHIDKIVRDNLGKMAQRILVDLPHPQILTTQENIPE